MTQMTQTTLILRLRSLTELAHRTPTEDMIVPLLMLVRDLGGSVALPHINKTGPAK